jgi:hypothetical protein
MREREQGGKDFTLTVVSIVLQVQLPGKLSTRRQYLPQVSDPSDLQYPQPIPMNTHTLCTGMGIWQVRVWVALE